MRSVLGLNVCTQEKATNPSVSCWPSRSPLLGNMISGEFGSDRRESGNSPSELRPIEIGLSEFEIIEKRCEASITVFSVVKHLADRSLQSEIAAIAVEAGVVSKSLVWPPKLN